MEQDLILLMFLLSSLCWPELANYGAECNMPASEFHNITFRSLIIMVMIIMITVMMMVMRMVTVVYIVESDFLKSPHTSYDNDHTNNT